MKSKQNILFDLDITENDPDIALNIEYTELPKEDSQPNDSEPNSKQNLEALINYELDQDLAKLQNNVSSLINTLSLIEHASLLLSPYDNISLYLTISQ